MSNPYRSAMDEIVSPRVTIWIVGVGEGAGKRVEARISGVSAGGIARTVAVFQGVN